MCSEFLWRVIVKNRQMLYKSKSQGASLLKPLPACHPPCPFLLYLGPVSVGVSLVGRPLYSHSSSMSPEPYPYPAALGPRCLVH